MSTNRRPGSPLGALGSRPWLAVLLVASLASEGRGQSVDEEKEATAEAPARPAHMPLSPLPEPPSLELGRPRPAASEAIARLLRELRSSEPTRREAAVRQLLEAKVDWVPALARELDRLAERGGRPEMARQLDQVRSKLKESPEDGVLERVLELNSTAESSSNLVELLAIARMLTAIGTTPAARELIRIYVRFGEFMRPTVQRHLETLGDRSLAALVEAQQHAAAEVARWAKRQLDLRGKAIVHELVRTEDTDALADILVALGRIRELDAAPILISYAATERSQIRVAAREGLALLGEAAAWKLRDAYLDTTGRRAAREWTWKRTARELFTEFDRLRLARVYEAFDAGLAAEKKGDLEAMKVKFDEVLLHNPLFESREQMAPGYLAYAKATLEKNAAEASLALRRVERLGTREQAAEAQSLRYTLEAKALDARGVYDLGLLNKAIALQPDNPEALELLAREPRRAPFPRLARYGLAAIIIAVSGFGVLASLGLTLRFRRQKARGELPQAEPTPAPGDAAPSAPSPAAPSPAAPSAPSPAAPSAPGAKARGELPLTEPTPAPGDAAPSPPSMGRDSSDESAP